MVLVHFKRYSEKSREWVPGDRLTPMLVPNRVGAPNISGRSACVCIFIYAYMYIHMHMCMYGTGLCMLLWLLCVPRTHRAGLCVCAYTCAYMYISMYICMFV